jgi:ankyrin repeat protein
MRNTKKLALLAVALLGGFHHLATKALTRQEEELFSAVKADDQERITKLLKDRVNINVRDNNGLIPLHHVLHEAIELDPARLSYAGELDKQIQLADFLINRGADINSEDRDGKTVLNRCIDQCRVILISKLISRGARVSDKDLARAREKLSEDWCKPRLAMLIMLLENYIDQHKAVLDSLGESEQFNLWLEKWSLWWNRDSKNFTLYVTWATLISVVVLHFYCTCGTKTGTKGKLS